MEDTERRKGDPCQAAGKGIRDVRDGVGGAVLGDDFLAHKRATEKLFEKQVVENGRLAIEIINAPGRHDAGLIRLADGHMTIGRGLIAIRLEQSQAAGFGQIGVADVNFNTPAIGDGGVFGNGMGR
jgi:hypothetical protein